MTQDMSEGYDSHRSLTVFCAYVLSTSSLVNSVLVAAAMLGPGPC